MRPRNSRTRLDTWVGASILRLNRIKPHGRSARMKSRSAALSSSPDTPVMNARLFMGPISPRTAQASRKRPLIPLDETLPAGSFQAGTDLNRLVRRGERAGKCPVIDTLLAEIDAFDQGRVSAENAWE